MLTKQQVLYASCAVRKLGCRGRKFVFHRSLEVNLSYYCNAGHASLLLWTPCSRAGQNQEFGSQKNLRLSKIGCVCWHNLHRGAFALSWISHLGKLSQMPNRWAWASIGEEIGSVFFACLLRVSDLCPSRNVSFILWQRMCVSDTLEVWLEYVWYATLTCARSIATLCKPIARAGWLCEFGFRLLQCALQYCH